MVFAKRILRYAKGTINFGPVYEKGHKSATLYGFSDSDLIGDIVDRKSTSGQLFFLASMAMS